MRSLDVMINHSLSRSSSLWPCNVSLQLFLALVVSVCLSPCITPYLVPISRALSPPPLSLRLKLEPVQVPEIYDETVDANYLRRTCPQNINESILTTLESMIKSRAGDDEWVRHSCILVTVLEQASQLRSSR